MISQEQQFVNALEKVGGRASRVETAAEVAAYIREHLAGFLLVPSSSSLARAGLSEALAAAGIDVREEGFRSCGAAAAGGLTGSNFGIATTGTVVLESTREDVRIATTLPEKHFVLLDPAKILANGMDAVPLMRRFHEELPQAYLAYLTGPSRTADIERVLTIGVHGPKELHVMLWPGLSADPMEA